MKLDSSVLASDANTRTDRLINDSSFRSNEPPQLGLQLLRFALFGVTIFCTYGAVLTPGYAFADDFFYLGSTVLDKNWFASLIATTALQARPLNGFLLGWSLSLFHSLNDFAYLHFFGMVGLALLACLTYNLCRRCDWNGVQSFCVALSLISLPSMQVLFAWSVTSFYVLSMLAAFAAVKLLTYNSPGNALLRQVLAAGLLVSGLTIYQPATMFYWVFVAIYFASNSLKDNERWSFLLKSLLVFGAATVADLVLFELAKHYYGTAGMLPQRSHLTQDVGQKLSWFLNGPLVDAFNFNKLMPTSKIAKASALFIGGGLLLHFWTCMRTSGKNVIAPTLMATLALLTLIPLSYLPNLSIAENFYSYRTEFGLGSLVLFLALLSAKALIKFTCKGAAELVLNGALIITCAVSVLSAYSHEVDFFVRPQLLETKLIKEQLSGKFGPKREKEPLLMSRSESLAPYIRYDEFGLPSFACPWVKEPGILLLKREVVNERSASLIQTSSPSDKPSG